MNQQELLQRYKTLADATISYRMEQLGGNSFYDGVDFMQEFCDLQLQEAEQYFTAGQLDALKGLLRRLTLPLWQSADMQYCAYIKEKTGLQVDLFRGLPEKIEPILTRGKIGNKKEYILAQVGLEYYRQTLTEADNRNKLYRMICHYQQEHQKTSVKTVHTRNIRKEANGLVQEIPVQAGDDPSPQLEEYISLSPEGNRRLRVVRPIDKDTEGLSHVDIHLRAGVGNVFAARGPAASLKAYWKDNETVVIEMHPGLLPIIRHHTYQSFGETIYIEYILADS